jgi:hypothetical protein
MYFDKTFKIMMLLPTKGGHLTFRVKFLMFHKVLPFFLYLMFKLLASKLWKQFFYKFLHVVRPSN